MVQSQFWDLIELDDVVDSTWCGLWTNAIPSLILSSTFIYLVLKTVKRQDILSRTRFSLFLPPDHVFDEWATPRALQTWARRCNLDVLEPSAVEFSKVDCPHYKRDFERGNVVFS